MVIKILLAHQNRQSNGNLGRQAALILLGFSKVFSASEMLRFDCDALPPMPVRYRPRDRGSARPPLPGGLFGINRPTAPDFANPPAPQGDSKNSATAVKQAND
jgi:hypothetical protein